MNYYELILLLPAATRPPTSPLHLHPAFLHHTVLSPSSLDSPAKTATLASAPLDSLLRHSRPLHLKPGPLQVVKPANPSIFFNNSLPAPTFESSRPSAPAHPLLSVS